MSQEIKKEETFIKEEIIEVQIRKKSNKQKRIDTIRSVFKLFSDWSRGLDSDWTVENQALSNLGSQLKSQMQSGTFGKKRFTAADL